ncbi:hypothetical protein DSO57_1021444 [Entomophthora muscae]|uniref:Uncharacterized protein n=1 Tax=Entomophthora muscae TaxID=34485 RepID=A0ACC2SSK9_9FUNG|nr:hypothetical protein DSO57_1021444 [Entomophthora muscae]
MSSHKLIRTLHSTLANVLRKVRPTRAMMARPMAYGLNNLNNIQASCFMNRNSFRQYATSENGEVTSPTEGVSNNKGDHVFNDGKGRSAKDIIGRIACLQLILARWGIEAALQSGSPAQRIQASFNGINQTAKIEELQSLLTPKEKSMLLQPLGKWTHADLNDFEERWEEFGVFQWCLGIQNEVPSYFEEFHKSQLFMATGLVPGQPKSFLDFISHSPEKVSPRSQDDIKDQLTQAEVWHWRSQAQTLLALKDLNDFSQLPPAVRRMIEKLPQAISHTASLAHSRGFISEAVEDDFGVHSSADPSLKIENKMIAYRQLSEHTLNRLSLLAQARYHALAYLGGALQDYDDPISRLTESTSHGNVLGGLPHLWAPENEDESTEK